MRICKGKHHHTKGRGGGRAPPSIDERDLRLQHLKRAGSESKCACLCKKSRVPTKFNLHVAHVRIEENTSPTRFHESASQSETEHNARRNESQRLAWLVSANCVRTEHACLRVLDLRRDEYRAGIIHKCEQALALKPWKDARCLRGVKTETIHLKHFGCERSEHAAANGRHRRAVNLLHSLFE